MSHNSAPIAVIIFVKARRIIAFDFKNGRDLRYKFKFLQVESFHVVVKGFKKEQLEGMALRFNGNHEKSYHV